MSQLRTWDSPQSMRAIMGNIWHPALTSLLQWRNFLWFPEIGTSSRVLPTEKLLTGAFKSWLPIIHVKPPSSETETCRNQDWTWTQLNLDNLVQRYVTTCAKWRVGCLNKKLTTCCPILARNSRLKTHLLPSMQSQFNFSVLIRPLATCTITKDD